MNPAEQQFDLEIGKFPRLWVERGQRRGVRWFDVHQHLPEDALTAPGIPQLGDSYGPGYEDVVAVRVEPEAAPYRHFVRVDYESPTEFGFSGNLQPLGTRFTASTGQLQVRADAAGQPLLEPVGIATRAATIVLRTQQTSGTWVEAWDSLFTGVLPLVNSDGVSLSAIEGLNSEQPFNVSAHRLRPRTVNHQALQPGLLQVDFVFDFGTDLHKVTQIRRDQAGNPNGQPQEFEVYGTTAYVPFLEAVL